MPGGDRTGPRGMGPMTGRAAGFCAGYSMPGYANPMQGRGMGMGRGMGWGRGMGRGMGYGFRGGRGGGWSAPAYGYRTPVAEPFDAPPTRQQEIEELRNQARYFENALSEIKNRLSELEGGSKK